MPTTKKPVTPKPKIISAAEQTKFRSTKLAGAGKTQLKDFVNFIRTPGGCRTGGRSGAWWCGQRIGQVTD